MKHLLASCAVVALMAAPALAQSTTPPNDPLSDSNVIVDPATPEEPDVSIDAEVESQSDVTVTMAPETDEEAVAETDTDTTADTEMTAETETTETDDTVLQAEAESADTDMAEAEPGEPGEDVGTEMAEAEAADVEAVEAPVEAAELPAEYSTDDLNALMLAQLNDKAEEIASVSFVPETETFAETDTGMEDDASADMAMTESTPATETPVEDYAANQAETSVTPEADSYASAETQTEAEVAPEDYAATETETAVTPEAESYAATEMANEADATAEAYAGSETETQATPQSDLAMTDTVPSEEATTEDYASAETDTAVTPESETAMTDTLPSDETTTQDYASSATGTYVTPETGMELSDEAAIEDYAANESVAPEGVPETPEVDEVMTPVAPALEDYATEMADETDETILMAESEDGEVMIAQGDIDQTAVEIATGDPRFSTLVELVGIAGLEDELAMDGPYTVFAPTNDAFAALPEETLARLKSEEGKAELVEVLKAHVVEGTVMAADVPLAGQEVDTLAETSANVTGSIDGSLNIKGSNTVGDGIYASNGVVYAIDAVILPEATPEPMMEETEETEG